MDNMTTRLTTEQKFTLWAVVIILLRGYFQFYHMGWSLGSTIFDMYYVLVLHFSVLYSIEFLSRTLFKATLPNRQQYYLDFMKYWIFVFPLVPVVTLITHSSYKLSIPFFQYVPTFMVHKNFLPSGMLFVIPIMLYFLTRHTIKHTGLNLLKAFTLVAIANTLSYVIYYQWMLNVFYRCVEAFSGTTAMAVYSLFGISMLLVVKWQLVKGGVLSKRWLTLGFFMAYMYAFILVWQIINHLLSAA